MIYSMDGKTYSFSEKRLKNLFEAYSANAENYSKAYVTYISPMDFLSLTSSDVSGFLRKNEDKILDYKKLCGERQEIFLTVDFDSGEVVGHEGRHRMAALHFAGAEKVAIAVRDFSEKNKYTRQVIPEVTVSGEEFLFVRPRTKASGVVTLQDLVPVSRAYRDVVRELYGPDATLQSYLGKETCVGTVLGFGDNPETIKDCRDCIGGVSKYVHVRDEVNSQNVQDLAVPVGEFMEWIEIERLNSGVRNNVRSLEDQIKTADSLKDNYRGYKETRAVELGF